MGEEYEERRRAAGSGWRRRGEAGSASEGVLLWGVGESGGNASLAKRTRATGRNWCGSSTRTARLYW